jgi:hypothetical protein
MSETSYNFSTQKSKKAKHIQGGEKKVMKKSLSILLAIALVFTMFTGVALAEETAKSQLYTAGVLKGSLSGDTMDDATWTRQDVTVLLSRMYGVEAEAKATAKAHTFTDVTDPFYDGYISWAKAEGYFNGHSDVRFGFSDEITAQQFSAVILRVLGVEHDYANAVDAAVTAGVLPIALDNGASVLRSASYNVLVNTLNTEVEGGGTLGASLGLEGWKVDQATISSATAAGASKIEVAFTADASAATFAVKKGAVNVAVEKVEWNEAKTVATITAVSKFTEGTYTVTVAGIEGLEVSTKDITVANETITSLELSGELLPISDSTEVEFAAKNQYGEDMSVNPQSGYTWVYSSALVLNANTTTKAQVDLATGVNGNKVKAGDSVTITVVSNNGKQASKTYTVAAAPELTTLTLGELKLDDKDAVRLSATKTATVTLEAKDQYGNAIKSYGDLKNVSLVKNSANVTVAWQDKDGGTDDTKDAVIKVTAGALTANETIVLTSIIGSGATSSLSFMVYKAVSVDGVSVTAPTAVVADGDSGVKFGVSLTDQYGDAFKLADATLGANQDLQTFVASTSVTLGAITKDGSDLKIASVTGSGSVTITAVTKTGKSSSVTFVVQDARYASDIEFKDMGATKLLLGATTSTKFAITDQYGAKYEANDPNNKVKIELTKVSGTNGAITASVTGDVYTNTGETVNTLTAHASNKGVYKLTYKIVNNAETTTIDTVSQNFTVIDGLAASDTELTYSLSEVPTLSSVGAIGYKKEIKLTATDAGGGKVAIPSSAINNILSSDTGIVARDGVTNNVYGVAKGTAIVSVVYTTPQGTKVVNKTVTVSEDPLVGQTITVKKDEVAIANNLGPIDFFSHANFKVTVKDQFDGTSLSASSYVTFVVTTPAGTPSVVTNGTYDFNTNGTYTVTALTSNGLTLDFKVKVSAP